MLRGWGDWRTRANSFKSSRLINIDGQISLYDFCGPVGVEGLVDKNAVLDSVIFFSTGEGKLNRITVLVAVINFFHGGGQTQ